MAPLQKYPEVQAIVFQIGRPDDGTDPTGYNVEISAAQARGTLRRRRAKPRPRTARDELVRTMNADLERHLSGINWDFLADDPGQ
ncbi:MAG: hypothetical protein U0793_33095 [Gemmataceae bacterium]